MIFGLVLIQILPGRILALFKASEDMLAIGIPALRIISLSYIFAGISVVASAIFQAFGNALLSLLTAISRQLVVLLPAAYVLSLFKNINLIWWSFPIAEIASLMLSIVFLKHIYDKRLC